MATTIQPKLQPLVDRITSVSTIPQVVLRVVAITKDTNAGVPDLVAVVESDPALMVRCVQLVNSASHGIGRKVTSIKQAISLLGFKKIRDIALTNSVADVFKEDCMIGSYRRLSLWSHMVATAICAEIVVETSGVPGCEDAYTAGLLHDLGIIAEDQYAREIFQVLITHLTDSEPLSTQEQAHFGFDHTILGSRIAKKWRLPNSIGAAIRFHHMPQNYRGEHGAIVNIVAVANSIVSNCGFPSVGLNIVTRPDFAFDALGLDCEKSSAMSTAFLQRVADGALLLFQPDT